MANVFISYARRDRDRVLALASALEREGLSVWWDPNLVPGKRFRDIIAVELAAADSVVVVWTEASIRSDYVQDEAEEARLRGVLAPVLLEAVKPPAGFRQVQAADLTQWTGRREHPEFQMLVTAVRHFVELARAEEAEAEPASQPAAAAFTAAGRADKRGSAPLLRPASEHDIDFLPRTFDLFARPPVWLGAAFLVLLTGLFGDFAISGVAAAMVLWAGSMALASIGAGVGRRAKSAVLITSVGVALIVAASIHSAKGVVIAILVWGAVFALYAFVVQASTRGRRGVEELRRTARHAARQAARQAKRRRA